MVASQWSVADASTGRLMTAFHQGLKAGLPKDEAMRRAMAELAARSETAHPFYWAPFLVTGDPRPMGIPRRSPGPARRLAETAPPTTRRREEELRGSSKHKLPCGKIPLRPSRFARLTLEAGRGEQLVHDR